MTRTTPPRPVDIAALFPELAEHRGTATRLHPRPGAPGPYDSSVGGPLLWPKGEPWPYCHESHVPVIGNPVWTEGERTTRRILTAAWGRTRLGARLDMTDAERAELERARAEPTPTEIAAAEPLPLLALAQLYVRDVPGLIAPEGADLLQVLWCPFDGHEGDEVYAPELHFRWRRAADVVDVLREQPEPPVLDYDCYLPEPCVLHPEVVSEYEYGGLLPKDLDRRIREWEKSTGFSYQSELSIADGWKVGGFASWHLTDPYPMVCECGQDMRLLLTIASSEWDGGQSWRPIEDAAEPPGEFQSFGSEKEPTRIVVGRAYRLWVFNCPASFDHPHQVSMQ